MRRTAGQLPKVGLFCAGLGLALGCRQAPEDLRQWTPKDHTNTSNKAAGPTGQVNAAPPPSEAPPRGLDAVTLATWTSQCATCHGRVGKGDGPSGRMLKAADLSNPTWQGQVTDAQIRASIVGGKNAMPAFGNLPPDTVDNLVWLVRWFNSDQAAIQARMAQLKSSAPAPGTDSPSAAPRVGASATTSNPSRAAAPESAAPGPARTGATGAGK